MKENLTFRAAEMQWKAQEALKIEDPERGATTLEYAVIAMVVVGIILGAMRMLGVSIADVFQQAASALGG